MEDQYGKHSGTTQRRRSLLPLSNDQGDGYLPAFSRPRSAIPFSTTNSSRPLSPTSPRLPAASRNHALRKDKLEEGLEQPPGSPRRRASTPVPCPSTARRDLGPGGRKVSRVGGTGGDDLTHRTSAAVKDTTASGRSRSKSVGRRTSSSDNKGIVREQAWSKEGRSLRTGTPLVKSEAVRRPSRPSRTSVGFPRRTTTTPVTLTGTPHNVSPRGESRRETVTAVPVGKTLPPGQISTQAATTVIESYRPGGEEPSSRRTSVSISLSRCSSRLHLGADIPPPSGMDNLTSGTALPPSPTVKRATMGGLMNILAFRRKTMRSRHHRSGSAVPPGDLDEKEELELLEGDPLSVNAETNRFTLSLSPEAQFAMLKGYEDRLQRALAPSEYGARIENEADNDETEVDGERPFKPEVECLHAFQDLSQASDAAQYRTKMNWKLENAMDIIDCMRNNRGHHVTSDRFRSKVADPVRHFRRWNRACDHDLAMARVKLRVVTEGSP